MQSNLIESRIANLESGLRRWKMATVALSLSLVALVGIAAGERGDVPDLVKAKQFEVIGNNGKGVARLTTNAAGGSLILTNYAGKEVLVGECAAGGSLLMMQGFDQQGHTSGRSFLASKGAIGDSLEFRNENDRSVMRLSQDFNGGKIILFDEQGRPRWNSDSLH